MKTDKNNGEQMTSWPPSVNFEHAPWFIVNADRKKATHIALIIHLLGRVKYRHENKKLLSRNYGLVDWKIYEYCPLRPGKLNVKMVGGGG